MMNMVETFYTLKVELRCCNGGAGGDAVTFNPTSNISSARRERMKGGNARNLGDVISDVEASVGRCHTWCRRGKKTQ